MTLIEIALYQMFDEFKKYPVLQSAWASMNDKEQEEAFKHFVDIVSGVINSEAYSLD